MNRYFFLYPAIFIALFLCSLFSGGVCAEEINPQSSKEKLWQREISLGYNKTSGNTKTSQFSMSLLANRKRKTVDEIALKGDIYYSSSNKKMDAQKWYGMVRYAFSFGEEKKWYNFYKVEADHDKFANIDYRIIPAVGVGYWFSDEPDWKAMGEIAIGLEHTDFKNTKDNDEAVLVPRGFFEKKVFSNSKLIQDLTLYSSLEDMGDYRLHSETAFVNPLNDSLSLNISIIDDYNSNPAADTKKNDLRFISALTYSF